MRNKVLHTLVSILFAAEALASAAPAQAFSANTEEQVLQYRFNDGVIIKVHYVGQALKTSGTDVDFGAKVLDAAVMAYQTITQFEGFNSAGYTFASPDTHYAYDPDRTIDIFLGSPTEENHFVMLGSRNRLFKDAPCFDVIPLSETQHQAVILLPANYREFIKNWERINPSPMGARNLYVDLRGTLIHEMLHVILFYYNKNLNKSGELEHSPESSGNEALKNLDWYVEGLARYFETFAGARHDFYSQGFKQVLSDRIRFSRGGSNYFMRYPDQPFTRLRYENALFWRFMDNRYGMDSIEALSRVFRKDGVDFKEALQNVTGERFENILKTFALSVLQKDFGLKDDALYLNEIARTRLRFRDQSLYLLDGDDREKKLGKTCDTDWIGKWENTRVSHGAASIGGDNTDEADVSGWATDFYEISLDSAKPKVPKFRLHHQGEGEPLYLQVLCVSKGGSTLHKEWGPLYRHSSPVIDLPDFVRQNALSAEDIDRIYVLITNTDPQRSAPYEITLSE